MRTYQASRVISASPDTIWAILTDAAGYPSWDNGVTKIEGNIASGEKIKVHTDLSSRAFPVTVAAFEPGRRMVWSSGMPLGLFKGERTFTLTPRGENQTEFETREVFSGPLLGLIGRSIPDLTSSFERFAEGLKVRAEQGQG